MVEWIALSQCSSQLGGGCQLKMSCRKKNLGWNWMRNGLYSCYVGLLRFDGPVGDGTLIWAPSTILGCANLTAGSCERAESRQTTTKASPPSCLYKAAISHLLRIPQFVFLPMINDNCINDRDIWRVMSRSATFEFWKILVVSIMSMM